MTLISDILLKMFLTKLDSENIIVMSPSPGINRNCLSIQKEILRKRTIDDIREAFEAVDNWLALVREVLVEQGHHPVLSKNSICCKKKQGHHPVLSKTSKCCNKKRELT